jgi:hypothetical protein
MYRCQTSATHVAKTFIININMSQLINKATVTFVNKFSIRDSCTAVKNVDYIVLTCDKICLTAWLFDTVRKVFVIFIIIITFMTKHYNDGPSR